MINKKRLLHNLVLYWTLLRSVAEISERDRHAVFIYLKLLKLATFYKPEEANWNIFQ